MEPIQIISQDLFDKVRSRFQNLELGDKTGAVTIDPAEARFFDFDFVYEDVDLGRVSISLNDLGSLKIYYSQGITENKDDLAKRMWFNFLKEMRLFAMRRLLRFDTRDITKTNLDKNDFQYLASKQASKEEDPMTTKMNESRWMLEKSSKKTSRAVKGRTQVIVRHSESMAERRLGERSNPKRIKAIYIENADGERFKYPFIHPAGAFAMAQHVDHGGIPHDPAGKAIIKMSEQIAQLQEFKRQVQRSTLNDDATGISEKAIGRLQELKTRVEALGKRNYYESWLSEFNEVEHNDEMLSELDPVTFESYKSKFTQSNFNEELGKWFPLIHSIMQEKIDLEEYVKEDPVNEFAPVIAAAGRGVASAMGQLAARTLGNVGTSIALDKLSGNKDSSEEFAEWAEAVEQGRLDLDKITDNLEGRTLQDALSNVTLGTDGLNAWSELSNIFDFNDQDSDDADLKQRLFDIAQDNNELEKTGMDSPAITVFKNWVEEKFPEWKQDLPELFAGEQQLTPEPETGMQPAPAPQPGVNPNATPSPETGMNPAAKPGAPVAESKKDSMIEEIAKLVKSRFNESNPNVGPFNGHEGILLDVEKTISEKFGEKAGKQARIIAEKYMEKLSMKWQQKHGEPVMGERDDLQRLKELVGNIKAKVENEGILDKAKQFGKKVLDKVAPDDETLLKKLQKDVGVPQTGKPPEKKTADVEERRNFSSDELAGRMGSSGPGFNKTPAGKEREMKRKQDHLKGQMKFTQGQGGVSGPKGPLPEMAALKKLAGLAK